MRARRLGLVFAILVVLSATLYLWHEALRRRHQPLVLSAGTEQVQAKTLDLTDRKVIRILAVDGGGVRGMIPTAALIYLEQKTHRPIADLFDLFIGTSSGGIITMGCLVPGEDGKPRYTAEQIMQCFERTAPHIFTPPLTHTLVTLDGVLAPEYSSAKKNAAFHDTLGSCLFANLLKPSMLASFNISKAQPELLDNWETAWANYQAADLLGAATTFPGVFDPVVLTGAGKEATYLSDPGMVENDPSFAALQVVRRLAPKARIVLVHLGTGRFQPDLNAEAFSHWGEVHWLTEMLPSISNGNVQVTRRDLRDEQAFMGPDHLVYFDIDVDLPQGQFYHPFNGSPENLANIKALAGKSLQLNQAKLDALAEQLSGD